MHMETKILKFADHECIDIIRQGHVLAFPTETVFGLGVIYDSKEAFDELVSLKKRMPSKPFTIMVSKKEDIALFVDLNEKMKRLIRQFMPGEITIIFPAKKGLSSWLTLNEPTVGIRISSSEDVTNLINRVGKPMLVTSANMSGEPALYNEKEVIQQFNHKILGIVEGECVSNLPSTIVLIQDDSLKLIRQGSIAFTDILKEWEK